MCLHLQAMDMFDVADGYKSKAQALSRVHSPTMIIGVKSDILFPVWQQRQLAEQLKLSGYYLLIHRGYVVVSAYPYAIVV